MVHQAEFLAFVQQLYFERLRAAWSGGIPLYHPDGCPGLQDFGRAYRECIAAANAALEGEEFFRLSMQAQREANGMEE